MLAMPIGTAYGRRGMHAGMCIRVRMDMGVCRACAETPLESSRRGGHFEYRRVHKRGIAITNMP